MEEENDRLPYILLKESLVFNEIFAYTGTNSALRYLYTVLLVFKGRAMGISEDKDWPAISMSLISGHRICS